VGQTLTKDLLNHELKLVDPKAGFASAEVLLVFGVGDAALYRSLSSALKKEENRFLVFIESNEELFLKAREFPLAKDPKVRLFYFKEGDEEIFQQIAWEFVFLRFAYSVHETASKEAAHAFFLQMEHYHRGVDLLASDCEDMGLKVLSNAVANLSFLPRSKLGQSLEGKCAGMPAIICGAGPSLNSAIPLLTALKDRAILIAGGSAAAALSAHGITPHLLAGIDPKPPYRRFLDQDTFQAPFFYQGRFSHELLECVHGPLIWLPDGGSYPLEAWASAECGIFAERFDAGWTVSNFCTSLATHLGCTTILFVCMDFSCGPDEIYASKMSGDENRDALIEIEKDKLYSKRDWLMSAEWTSAFAAKNPQVQWINASSGGIDLPGLPRRALSEVAQEHLIREWDVEGMLHSLIIQAQATDVTSEKVADVRKKLKESFNKSLNLCDTMLKVWEKHYPSSPLEKGEYAVLEHELDEQVCARFFLMPLWNVWKRPILRTSFHPLGQHVHRLLFFKKALEMHLPYLRSFS
jgi:hypothetical protein